MEAGSSPEVLKIRKYPNRRFYDASRSRHVTLDDLHQLVRAGNRIEVTDADRRDITNVVLTQILLEHDPPKLDLFPASLLHQAVQANQDMVRRFIDEYFSKAMDHFLNSRKQFDTFLAQSGLSPMQPTTPFDWARRFLQGFEKGGPNAPAQPSSPAAVHDVAVESLRGEVEKLRVELARLSAAPKPEKSPRTRPSRKTRPPRKGRR